MIIGIDATPFSHPQPGGYKTYVTNLLLALTELKSHHSFRVFVDRETPGKANALLPGKSIVITNSVPIVRQTLREQYQFPRQVAKECCAIMHFTANTAPLIIKTPYVLTLHDVIALTAPQAPIGMSRDSIWQWMINTYARQVIPSAAANSAAIITVSDFEKQQVVKHLGVSPDKVYSIHLAAGSVFRAFSPLEQEIAHKRVSEIYQVAPRYILAVGHEPRKNIASVLRAYSGLEQSLRKQVGLLIVCARQEAQQKLQTDIAELHLTESVRVTGGVTQEELLHLYNGADVLIFPSLRESFGLPPLEAMACGTPVISSNTSSLPEVLGDAGILVTPTDISQLTDALEQVLTNPQLSQELSERGLARSRQFTRQKTAQETLALYEQVAARIRHS